MQLTCHSASSTKDGSFDLHKQVADLGTLIKQQATSRQLKVTKAKIYVKMQKSSLKFCCILIILMTAHFPATKAISVDSISKPANRTGRHRQLDEMPPADPTETDRQLRKHVSENQLDGNAVFENVKLMFEHKLNEAMMKGFEFGNSIGNQSQVAAAAAAASWTSTPAPIQPSVVVDIEVSTLLPEQSIEGLTNEQLTSSIRPTIDDSLVDLNKTTDWDPDDRYIQYDNSHLAAVQDTDQTRQRPHLANYKLADEREDTNASLPLIVSSDSKLANTSSVEHSSGDDDTSDATQSTNSTQNGRPHGQARSMAISGGPQSNHLRLPQHSKPPYASYNQFHHRNDHVLNNNHQANATASLVQPTKATISERSSSTSASDQPTMAGQQDRSSSNATSPVLAQSIDRISSDLAADSAWINKNSTSVASNEGNIDEAERTAQKLAPIDTIVLDPIPVRHQTNPNDNQQMAGDQNAASQLRLQERYFQTPTTSQFESNGKQVDSTTTTKTAENRRPVTDHFGLSSTSDGIFQPVNEPASFYLPDLQQLSSKFELGEAPAKPHDSHGASPESPAQFQQLNEPNQQVNSLTKRTIASVHEQLTSGDEMNRQPVLVNRAGFAGPPSGHYAASLINITAPIVSPLSASEAMEADQFHGQQRAPALRPQANLYSNQVRNHQGTPSAHRDPLQGIYLQPANQFAPPRPTVGSLEAIASSLADQTNVASRTTLSGSMNDKERVRLEAAAAAAQMAGSMRSSPPPFSSPSPGHLNLNLNGGVQQASGFRSPLYQHHHFATSSPMSASSTTNLPILSSYLNSVGQLVAVPSTAGVSTSTPSSLSAASNQGSASNTTAGLGRPLQAAPSSVSTSVQYGGSSVKNNTSESSQPSTPPATTTTTNGFITGSVTNTTLAQQQDSSGSFLPAPTGGATGNKRASNLTRVEHISAECSNDLIRTVIIFNGTFKGIIYSSGYVRDSNCLYINGTGKTRYDFSIKLNQCGTLGKQEVHSPNGPNEVRRRDHLMWNALSIQYNPIIEQEWDEHFRVSCEYGSDFWKTVSFSPFNVETNTGSPVVFTVDPPQCQMEILRGHGMVGPRQEAISGPVTVGDPLTLLIHMKSERAGYDILVKNCIAHNGGQQKMQLIDSNGCVVNERFISPFRGTYNDNDLKHVTLYSYLKAFRFTGSPVLYLECEVHMCQSACPPQMCYWRRLSKRSLESNSTHLDYQHPEDDSSDDFDVGGPDRQPQTTTTTTTTTEATSTVDLKQSNGNLASKRNRRSSRMMRSNGQDNSNKNKQLNPMSKATDGETTNISDKISLFQALEVRDNGAFQMQSNDPSFDQLSSTSPDRHHLYQSPSSARAMSQHHDDDNDDSNYQGDNNYSLMCYRRAEVFGFLFMVGSTLLAAISITVGCCLRAATLRSQARKKLGSALGLSSANLCHSPMSQLSLIGRQTTS